MTNRQKQYTVRRVPVHVDKELRRRAAREHKSLNEVALQALERGLNVAAQPVRHHDLDDLIGSWVEDPEFDRALADMHQIDTKLWK